MANPGNFQEYMRYINYNGIIYVLGGYFKGKLYGYIKKFNIPILGQCEK